MKRIFAIAVICLFTGISLSAGSPSGGLSEGFCIGIETSGGISVNKRMNGQSGLNWSYGLDMSGGYRCSPHLTVAAGFGGYSYFNRNGLHARMVQTTSVPVFIRLRSDVLDRKVSPYVQMDLGYSFIFLSSRDAAERIKTNDKVFIDRVYAMGYDSLEDYETAFRAGAGDRADQAWNEELSRLRQFSNGDFRYIVMDDNNIQYGKKGFFGTVDLGVSWAVGNGHRMNAGLSASLSQSYYGTCLRTLGNDFLHFGREDYLPYDRGEEKVYVRTLGQKDFLKSFDLDLRIKVGFTF